MFDPEISVELATLATVALRTAGGSDTLTAVSAAWGVETGSALSPDLLLVDDADRVHAVVELKRGANANATGLTSFPHADLTARFADEQSQALPQWLGTPDPHVNDFDQCDCWVHTGRTKEGLIRGGLWQIDVYRHWRCWVPDWVTLTDPQAVSWIVIDEGERALEEMFPGAYSVDLWRSASLTRLAQELLPGLDAPLSDTAQQHLRTVLRMLAA